MRSFLPVAVLTAATIAVLVFATQAQSQSRFNSQAEYLAYVAECAGLFFTNHAQYEEMCVPGAAIAPVDVIRTGGVIPPSSEEPSTSFEPEPVG